MKKYLLPFAVILLTFFGCSSEKLSDNLSFSPADYVDPFIGTRNMGHCYPGATVPFGMVQLSPETDSVLFSYGKGYNRDVYRYCSGYQYDDSTITGFAHTHFHGTGHSDLGDFLVMPFVGELKLNPGTSQKPESGYRSRFSHKTEKAEPGYYSVLLEDYGITAELTATERVGMHRYTFPESKEGGIILDMTSGIYNYDGKVIWSSLRMENDSVVTGYRQTNGWARTRYIYFAMEFSKPVKSYGFHNEEDMLYKGFWRHWKEDDNFPERAGKKLKGHFRFDTEEGEEIILKMALSAVSTEGAMKNLKAEVPGWDFDAVRASAKEKWNKELSRLKVDCEPERMTTFYTALYHCFLSPIIYSDTDNKYRGLDGNIHLAEGFTNYTIFSLWDTYRALHPLFTILQPDRTNDMISSMLVHYDQSVQGILPIWSHHANENWCMIGYHSVPVIADAYLKGLRGYDTEKAYRAVIESANYDNYMGLGEYKKLGFVPEDISGNSASKTLEYAYDDWTIYKFASSLGKSADAKIFRERGNSYRNIFDKETGFMRAKNSDGSFIKKFDPMDTHGAGFIEGNAWNYSLYVPHDVSGFISLLGGEDKLITWLDNLFTMEIKEEHIAGTEDVTRDGIIGNYVHGNEPSHHVPYLYNYAGAPWKTEEKVRLIIDTMYGNEPDGLCGNDDCGQMSAWYVFSALGFYPVAPGSNEYVIGTPSVKRGEIVTEKGKKFVVIAKGLSKENVYINSIELNGKEYSKTYIKHSDIINGGELIFNMSPEPNKSRGTNKGDRPYSLGNTVD